MPETEYFILKGGLFSSQFCSFKDMAAVSAWFWGRLHSGWPHNGRNMCDEERAHGETGSQRVTQDNNTPWRNHQNVTRSTSVPSDGSILSDLPLGSMSSRSHHFLILPLTEPTSNVQIFGSTLKPYPNHSSLITMKMQLRSNCTLPTVPHSFFRKETQMLPSMFLTTKPNLHFIKEETGS